jgi:hypothetical protein
MADSIIKQDILGGGGGRGEKWPKPCMYIWIIKEKKVGKKINKNDCTKTNKKIYFD